MLPRVTEALISGLLAGYGVAIPVGAIGVLILSLSARTRLLVGAGAGLGVATADGLYAVLAAAGGAAIAGLIRPVATPLRWAAVVVLFGMAARTAVVAWRHYRDPDRAARPDQGLTTPGRAYLGLLALTLLNPATIIYFSALILGRQADAPRPAAAVTIFVLAAFAASASWQLLLAAGGSAVGRLVAGPRGRLGTALFSSALIVVLAVRSW
jgi:arginine exporter protein ArgO